MADYGDRLSKVRRLTLLRRVFPLVRSTSAGVLFERLDARVNLTSGLRLLILVLDQAGGHGQDVERLGAKLLGCILPAVAVAFS